MIGPSSDANVAERLSYQTLLCDVRVLMYEYDSSVNHTDLTSIIADHACLSGAGLLTMRASTTLRLYSLDNHYPDSMTPP